LRVREGRISRSAGAARLLLSGALRADRTMTLARAFAIGLALAACACGASPPRAISVANAPATAEPSAPVRRYRIVSEASSVTAVASAALGSYTLRIGRVEGHIDWVPSQPDRSRFVFEADMRTVSGSIQTVTRIVRNQFLHVD